MSYENIIRAWKDEDYRMSLSEEERAQLPENPAGLIELMDAEMSMVGGGYGNDTQIVTAADNLCGSTFCNGNCDPKEPYTWGTPDEWHCCQGTY